MKSTYRASLTRGCFAAAVAAVLIAQLLVFGTTYAMAEEADGIEVVAASEDASSDTPDGAEAADGASEDEGFATCGSCEWRVDGNGELLIRPSDGEEGTLDSWDLEAPWHTLASDIISVRVEGIVHATTCVDMFYLCYNCTSMDLAGLETSEVDNMSSMFEQCWSLETLDISMLDTRRVMLTNGMFYHCDALQQLTVGENNAFYETSAFPEAKRSEGWWSFTDARWYTANAIVSSRSGKADTYFAEKPTIDEGYTICGTCQWRVDEHGELIIRPLVGNEGTLASWGRESPWCGSAAKITNIRIEGTVHCTTCYAMFEGCSRLVTCELTGLDTSGVTEMSNMFGGCESFVGYMLGNLDTSSVESMDGMFYGCKSIPDFNLSIFDLSHVTSMLEMFRNCEGLTSIYGVDVDTHSLTSMSSMFTGCKRLEDVDFSCFDTTNVSGMSGLFRGCDRLAQIKVGDKFDFKSDDALPGEGEDSWWSTADKRWYDKAEIVRNRSRVQDTYRAGGELRERIATAVPLLDGRLGVTFFADLGDLSRLQMARTYVTFSISGRGECASLARTNLDFKDETGTLYGYTCYLSPMQMADTITATLHFPYDGRERTREKRISLKRCITTTFGLVPQKMENLLFSMRDYGHYAQAYLSAANGWTIGDGADQHALMDDHLVRGFDKAHLVTETEPFASHVDLASDVKSVKGVFELGPTMSLNVLVRPNGEIEDAAPTATIDGESAKVVTSGDAWCVTIDGVRAQDLDKEHTVCFVTPGGTTTVKLSGLSLVHNAAVEAGEKDQDVVNLMGAIYSYYTSAKKCGLS